MKHFIMEDNHRCYEMTEKRAIELENQGVIVRCSHHHTGFIGPVTIYHIDVLDNKYDEWDVSALARYPS